MIELDDIETVKTLRSTIDAVIDEIREISIGCNVLNRNNFDWQTYKKKCYERLREAFFLEQETYKFTKFKEEKKIH